MLNSEKMFANAPYTLHRVMDFNPYEHLSPKKNADTGEELIDFVTGEKLLTLRIDSLILWFRKAYPEGSIITELIENSQAESSVTFKASIYTSIDAERPIATGYAKRFSVDGEMFPSFSTAESIAIINALRIAGFGPEVHATLLKNSMEEMPEINYTKVEEKPSRQDKVPQRVASDEVEEEISDEQAKANAFQKQLEKHISKPQNSPKSEENVDKEESVDKEEKTSVKGILEALSQKESVEDIEDEAEDEIRHTSVANEEGFVRIEKSEIDDSEDSVYENESSELSTEQKEKKAKRTKKSSIPKDKPKDEDVEPVELTGDKSENLVPNTIAEDDKDSFEAVSISKVDAAEVTFRLKELTAGSLSRFEGKQIKSISKQNLENIMAMFGESITDETKAAIECYLAK